MDGMTIVMPLHKTLADGRGNALYGEVGKRFVGRQSIVVHQSNIDPTFVFA